MSEAIRHEWKKILINGNEYSVLFLTSYFMSCAHNSAKNYYALLLLPLSPRMVFSDLAFWRQDSSSVTSRECEVLALWRHIRWLFLHLQIDAKAIFVSE